jgi:hypothetical protein
MGLTVKRGHPHVCGQCGKTWTHPAYACAYGEEMDCIEHPATPEPKPTARPADAWAPMKPIDDNWVKRD